MYFCFCKIRFYQPDMQENPSSSRVSPVSHEQSNEPSVSVQRCAQLCVDNVHSSMSKNKMSHDSLKIVWNIQKTVVNDCKA